MEPGTRRRWVIGGLLGAALGAALFSNGVRQRLGLGLHAPAPAPTTTGTAESRSAKAAPSAAASPRAAVASNPTAPNGGSATSSAPTSALATQAGPSPRVETVVRARWGGRPGELGKKEANESAPEGPMSFVVDQRGRAFVLDQVNSRVEVFEQGREPRSIPLPSDTFQDLALAKNDGVVLLDRLGTSSLAFVDGSGRVTHEIDLVGRGISAGGDVTGLFQESDGTWVEVGHQNLVRIADADGNPDIDREIVQGRFAGDGQSILRASLSGERAAYVSQKTGEAAALPLTKVRFDMPIQALTALETDARGRIFLGADLAEESPVEPFDLIRAAEVVVVLSPSGTELSRLELPPSVGAEESFRRIRVGADGALYQLAFEDEGAVLRKAWL